MAESWDNKTKATVQKIPLLTVCASTCSYSSSSLDSPSAVGAGHRPRYDRSNSNSINAEVMLIRTVGPLGPFEEQICSF